MENNNSSVDEYEKNNRTMLKKYKMVDIDFGNSNNQTANLEPCYVDTVKNIIYTIPIPCEKLLICKKISVESYDDFDLFPNVAGLYWIATTEPINHSFNSCTHSPKIIAEKYNIVYNGSTCNI